MQRSHVCLISMISVVVGFSSIFSSVFAELPQKFIDSTNSIIDTLRKSECQLTITGKNQVVAGKEVKIQQIRNDFGFGASIGKKWFTKTDSAKYGDAFRSYFEWATPENEMKWPSNEEADDYQDFELADSLISWCQKYDIKVRGHNLFWNERREWMPSWALELNQADFKGAMERRIDGTMAHFKGKVAHWDIINEIVHYKDVDGKPQTARPGLLAQFSGDDDIFSWIFKRARSVDTDVAMAVNEYSVIEKLHHTKEYIEAIKDIESKGGKIDVIGLEGHFDDFMVRDSFMERIDTIAKSVPNMMWLTEVDFTLPGTYSERADKMEELMRSAFAYPRIGGLVLWAWWEGNQWKDGLSSFLIDSSYKETEIGSRWRTIRDSWRTDTSGTTNSNGEYTFKGFHGKYIASVQNGDSLFCDTFYLAPGKGKQLIDINLAFSVGVKPTQKVFGSGEWVSFKGKKFTIPNNVDKQTIFLSTYTLDGRFLAKIPAVIKNGIVREVSSMSIGMYIVKIGNSDQLLYKGIDIEL